MKTTTILILGLFIGSSLTGQAQTNNRIALQLSHNQVTISYRLQSDKIPVWVEPYVGVANQDVNAKFDDKLGGLKVGIPLYSTNRLNFYAALNTGIYIPVNHLYKAATPYLGALGGVELQLGKNHHHGLLLECGYTYGTRDYRQYYESKLVAVTTVGEFKVSPLYYALGYCYKF
ncbi:MAG TPA: hypothetical protein VMW01_15480 [Williamwhitmania sp.]|nr:hypothetical protein [Williamwhitmania sp.]